RLGQFQPGAYAAQAEIPALAEIRLHEDAEREAPAFPLDHARGRARTCLETAGYHAGAAAHAAFLDRAARSAVQRGCHMLEGDMVPVDVVEEPVIGLAG